MTDGVCRQLTLPNLQLPLGPITASLWLIPTGREVVQGDRVLEIAIGGVTIDLSAPVNGFLTRHLVEEDDHLRIGQPLAEIFCGHAEPAVA